MGEVSCYICYCQMESECAEIIQGEHVCKDCAPDIEEEL